MLVPSRDHGCLALAEAAIALWSAPVPGVVTARSGFDWTRVDDAVVALPAGT